jgi:zinc transport system permease protein
MQLALVAGVVVGACAPLIGTFLVQRRLSLLGDGIGHLAFAGVAAGLLLGIWPVWAALVVAVAGALGLERLRSRGQASGDLALALFFYSGIAAGVVLVGLSDSFNAGLLTYLFGGILTVTRQDVLVVAGLGVVIVTAVAVCGRALFAVVLDEESARVGGLPVDGLNSLLAALAAVTVVAAMRVVGILLVAALMVLPVATAQVLARSFRATLWVSAVVGVASVVIGLAAARIWGLAPGGTIVLVAAAAFGVTSVTYGRSHARTGMLGG